MSRAPSGSSRTATCQCGPCSSSSGRARQSSRIGASVIAAGSPASRPSSVGSAQWMSSTITTSGRASRLRPQEVPDRPLGLRRGRGALRQPEQLRDLRGDDARVRPTLDVRLDERARLGDRMLVVDPGQLADDLADRPERDPLSVRKAPAAHDPRTGADLRDELGGQARLADARLADHGDETAFAPRDHGVELPLEQLQLLLASRERRPRAPRHRPDAAHLEEPVGPHRLGLPLGSERRHGLGVHRAPDEPERPLAEQHLARAGVPARAARPR